MASNIMDLAIVEIDLIGGASEPFEDGRSDGEAFGEAVEDFFSDVGEAISDGWDWVVDQAS